MSVDLFDATLTETSNDGFLSYAYVETYMVILNDKAGSPFEVLAQPGIPLPRVSYLIPSGQKVFVIRRVPRRVKDGTDRKWMVDVTYGNNQSSSFLRNSAGEPVADPTEAVKSVDIEFEEIQEPITTATLRGITKDGPDWGTGTTAITIPGTHPLQTRTTKAGGIINSACEDNPEFQTYATYRKRITVWRYEDSYPVSHQDYLGTYNTDTITISESDDSGSKYSEQFVPKKLLMKNIIKQNVWRDSVLYYRIGYVMDVAPINTLWDFATVDKGTKKLVSDDQINPETESAYVPAESVPLIGSKETGLVEITTGDGFGGQVAMGEAVPLNGKGNPIYKKAEMGSQFWLNWDGILTGKAFAALNL